MFRLKLGADMILVLLGLILITGVSQAQLVLDFEDGNLDAWEVIDDVDLGDAGPSTWEIRNSQLGLDGKALYQGSNIWGDATDSCLMGTFIIYKGEQFTDFVIDVDVVANDNDGMGLVWAYSDTSQHYRAIMINDGWPDVPVDGVKGPCMKISKRISNSNPWYELLGAMDRTYVPYQEGQKLHWTLEVTGGSFTFTREDGLSISAEDHSYDTGYVGIQLYAQQAEFDNFTILDTYPVDPAGKLASMWGRVKVAR